MQYNRIITIIGHPIAMHAADDSHLKCQYPDLSAAQQGPGRSPFLERSLLGSQELHDHDTSAL